MEEKQQNNLKKVITVLLILLLLSITALAGVKIYKNSKVEETQSVTVPDNIITPEKDNSETVAEKNAQTESEKTQNTVAAQNPVHTADKTEAAVISLHKRHSGDNKAFDAGNMFPGDVNTRHYCVQITHEGLVAVHFDADVRDGYEKLAEVLKCKVTLLTTGEVIFDGLMKDVHDTVRTVDSSSKTTSELYYKIEAYLDTSVGNEYQNKKLVADFEWWIENEENLRTPSDTGDATNTYLWIGVMTVSLLCLIILILFKRKKEEADEQ